MGKEVGDNDEGEGKSKNDQHMEEDGLESVEAETFEGFNLFIGGDIPIGGEGVSKGNDAIGKPSERDKGAAEETAAEGNDIGDAVNSVATTQKIRNEEGKRGGAEGKDERVKDEPETVKREHGGADDNETDEDVDEPEG